MYILPAAVTAQVLSSGDSKCPDRPIKLHIHLDLTASFEYLKAAAHTTLPKLFSDLKKVYPNFEWAATGFGDRLTDSPCEQEDQTCYYDWKTPRFDSPPDIKDQELNHLLDVFVSGQYDFPEDPFDGVPRICQNSFGDYNAEKDELRLLLFITDAAGKYSPEWDDQPGGGAQDVVVKDDGTVPCDCSHKWLTLEQIKKPLNKYHVYPIALLHAGEDQTIPKWKQFFAEAGYAEEPFLEIKEIEDSAVLVKYIEKVIDSYSCKHPVPPASSTTTTTAAPTASSAATSPEKHGPNIPAIASAAIGAVGLLGGIGYLVQRRESPPSLSVEEVASDNGESDADRETTVQVNEAAFQN